MGSKKNVDMSTNEDKIKIVTSGEETSLEDTETPDSGEPKKAEKKISKRNRSKKYISTRSKVDRTKKYSITEAVALVKKLSYSSFAGTITLDAVAKEIGKISSVTLPHSTGKSIRVSIVTDEVLTQIEAGNIDFDVLITAPQFMPKLAKFARVLGPKGLMPNPKNGTVTPKPELKKKELEKGTFELKTEKKAPVVHVVIGKTSMDDAQLVENIETIFTVAKGRLLSAAISATMSPGIKLDVE